MGLAGSVEKNDSRDDVGVPLVVEEVVVCVMAAVVDIAGTVCVESDCCSDMDPIAVDVAATAVEAEVEVETEEVEIEAAAAAAAALDVPAVGRRGAWRIADFEDE